MKIKEIQTFDVGTKVMGGFPLTVKTLKKKWETRKGWVQQCVLTDDTGDILADVFTGKKEFHRSWTIDIIVAEIQATDTGKKLYVSQWSVPTANPDDLPFMDFGGFGGRDEAKTIRGRILTCLTTGKFQAGATDDEVLDSLLGPKLKKIVDLIMQG